MESNETCYSCLCLRAHTVCFCTIPPRGYCQPCSLKHASHKSLPISAARHASEPGFLEQYTARTGLPQQITRQALYSNLDALSTVKTDVSTAVENVITMLKDKRDMLCTELDAFSQALGAKIEETIKEVDSNICEVDPDFASDITRRLFRNEKENMKIVASGNDFSEVEKQFQGLISQLKVFIDVYDPDFVQDTHSESSLIIRQKPSSASENRQLNASVGRVLQSDGSVIESSSKEKKPTDLGKRFWPDGSLFTSDCGKHLRADTRRGFTLMKFSIGGLLLGLLPVLLLSQLRVGCEMWAGRPFQTPAGLYLGHVNAQGEPHGYGSMTYSTGDTYEGFWSNGQKSGLGTLTTQGGEVTKGEWVSDSLSGLATKHYSDGRVFTGSFSNGSLHGFGVLLSPKSMSCGEFEGEVLHGEGCHISKKGDSYAGHWKSGRREGEGVDYSKNSLCHGSFQAGSKHGNATCVWPSLVVYSGEWRAGVKSGAGTEAYPAHVFKGNWREGQPTEGQYVTDEKFREEYRARKDKIMLGEGLGSPL